MMLPSTKKKLILPLLVFVLLGIGTLATFILVKSSQDIRQQASGGCQIGDPYCSCDINGSNCVEVVPDSPRNIVEQGGDLNHKGILSTSYSGNRATTEDGCGGVWQNDFCYMSGDEIAGGYIVVESGRYNYPYLEKKATYESLGYGGKSVSEKLGSESELGADCGGKGLAISGICYTYGSTINGYLVMPERTSGCDNSSGDYCYAHLEKIETKYDDWQSAVKAYEASGDYSQLEKLYQDTYNISFEVGALFDPNAENAGLLRAQVLMSALTNADVLKGKAAEQNTVLDKKLQQGEKLTAAEQSLYDFNQQIAADSNLDTRYQTLDQLSASTVQQTTINKAVNDMYQQLIEAGDNTKLNQITTQKFKEIFGYDPAEKYGEMNGVLNAFGIDPTKLAEDRTTYAALVQQQKTSAQQSTSGGSNQTSSDTDKLNQTIGLFKNGSSSEAQVKAAAIKAGFITEQQAKLMTLEETLSYIYQSSPDLDQTQAAEIAQEVISGRKNKLRERSLISSYTSRPDDTNTLESLYQFYIGHQPAYRMSNAEMEREIAKYSSQVALQAYLNTGNINYLQENYAVGRSPVELREGNVYGNERSLLVSIFGQEVGVDIYNTTVLPTLVNNAVNNFVQDPKKLETVCSTALGSKCNIGVENASKKLGELFHVMYPDPKKSGVNVEEMTLAYSNQLFAQAEEGKKQSFWEMAMISIGTSMAADGQQMAALTSQTGKDALALSISTQNESQANYSAALQTSKIFDAQNTFEYASQANVRSNLSDYTWGTSLGNAVMYDKIFDREYNLSDVGIKGLDAASMTWNQIETQAFNVTNNVENIATNYAIAVQTGYTGPVNTNVANLTLQVAENLGGDYQAALGYDYQAAGAGHYVQQAMGNIDATIADWAVTAGTYTSLAVQASNANASPYYYTAQTTPAVNYKQIASQANEAGDAAAAAIKQNTAESLVAQQNKQAAVTGDEVDLDQYISFQTDEEIVRSRQELNWETVEKVVAPVAAVVILPVAIASGAGLGVIAGVASSSFSLYQGAGAKASALELERVIISEDFDNRKNAAALAIVEAGGITYGDSIYEATYQEAMTTVENQVEMLNKQGNIMVASSAVAALTSGAGVISGFANAGNAALATGQTVNTIQQLAMNAGQVTQAMSIAGRLGGIGLSSYSTINSGQQAVAAAQSLAGLDEQVINGEMTQAEADAMKGNLRGQVAMSGLSSFVAASGVVGNSFGFIRNPSLQTQAITTKTDLILDIMNVPAGVAVDAQNVSQSCFNSSYPSGEGDCRDAWVGLALSLTQDVAQVRNSTNSFKNYQYEQVVNQGRVEDYAQKIALLDQRLTDLIGNNNRAIGENLELVDLKSYRQNLVNAALAINPKLVIPDLVEQQVTRVAVDASKLTTVAESNYKNLMTQALEVRGSDPDLSLRLEQQADDNLQHQQNILRINGEIAEIDRRVSQEAAQTSALEIENLRGKRENFVNDLDSRINDPNLKAANLNQENQQLLAAARVGEAFKAYDDSKVVAEQASIFERLNIPPPGEDLPQKRTGLASLIPGSAAQNKAIDLAELQTKLIEVDDLNLQKNQIEQDLAASRQINPNDPLVRTLATELADVSQKIITANETVDQLAPQNVGGTPNLWQKLTAALPFGQTSRNYDQAMVAMREMSSLNQEKIALTQAVSKLASQNTIGKTDQSTLDELKLKLETIDQKYAAAKPHVLQVANQAEKLLQSQPQSSLVAFLSKPLDGLKKILPVRNSSPNNTDQQNFNQNYQATQRSAEIAVLKSQLTTTKDNYNQLTKNQTEIQKSNAEIKRLNQELVGLEKQPAAALTTAQTTRINEIRGEVGAIQEVIKIVSNSVNRLESQLLKTILPDDVAQNLVKAQSEGNFADVLQTVRAQELNKISNGRLDLDNQQSRLIDELLIIKEKLSQSSSPENLVTQRHAYNQKLSELNESILGSSPQVEDYQKLSSVQQLLKNINVLDAAKTQGTNSDGLMSLLSNKEASIPVADPILAARLETIIRDAEFRTGVDEGIEFFNARSNQMDTFLKIFEGERVAIELTTAGGKTFVGSVLLRAQTELLGYDTGIYIAKPGQEAAIQTSMMKAYGVGEDKVVVLDSTRLSEKDYVSLLLASRFVVADPANLQFIRNYANNFADHKFSVANKVYKKLTQNTALYIDELQINLDPSRQAINSVGASSQAISNAYKESARLVGEALDETLLKNGGWGLGDNDFLVLRTSEGAEIAKFNEAAQGEIFSSLAQKMGISVADYNLIKDNVPELERAFNQDPEILKQKLTTLGVSISPPDVERIFDQIDMVNTFAQGLKMKNGTDYQRMKDTVLARNGGPDRPITVPAAGAVANEGQSYSAKLQAAMEYIGAKANGQTPDFTGLTASPNQSYKSTIADYLGDLRNSSVGAVTGALADGRGVVETALGLVTYRSTEAVEKILSIEGSATGERINVDRSYQINRDNDVDALVALKRSGALDQSAGGNSAGNLKVVMGFDGAKNPLDFAREMVRSGAFDESEFAVQNTDGSYSLVKINGESGEVLSSRDVTTKDIQDLYDPTKGNASNLVTIIGRGGATGDSIKTTKNIPGVTVTSFDTPEGLVAQAGARIDRGDDVATQFALIIKRNAPQINIDKPTDFLNTSKMTEADFTAFRNQVTQVQKTVEQAKNTQALDQGVIAASTRALSDLIRNSTDPKVQKWASSKLLEFYSEATTRDFDLVGGAQESLLARQKKISAQVDSWDRLLTDQANSKILKTIEATNPEIYAQMRSNVNANGQKLAYVSGEVLGKESVMTATNLSEFVDRHNKYVAADSESKYVADSGRPPMVDQIATNTQRNSVVSEKAKARVAQVIESVKGLRNISVNVTNPLKSVPDLLNLAKASQLVQNLAKLPQHLQTFVPDLKEVQKNGRLLYERRLADLQALNAKLAQTKDQISQADIVEKINRAKISIEKTKFAVGASLAWDGFRQNQVTPRVDAVKGKIAGFLNLETPQIKNRKAQILADFKITDEKLKDQLLGVNRTESLDLFITVRRATYKRLQNQFTSLNINNPPSVQNEEDYQIQLAKLQVTVEEIEKLQQDSALSFAETDDDGHLKKNEDSLFIRTNPDQFTTLARFRTAASNEIAGLDQESLIVENEGEEQLTTAHSQADYEALKNQFRALGTTVKAITNETDYEAELSRLAEVINGIEVLQAESGLKFLEMGENGKVAQENGAYQITRVDKGKNLSSFRSEAGKAIGGLAEENQQQLTNQQVVGDFVANLSNFAPQNMILSALKINLLRINQLIARNQDSALFQLTPKGGWRNGLASLKSLAEYFSRTIDENQRGRIEPAKKEPAPVVQRLDTGEEFRYQPIDTSEDKTPNKTVDEVRGENNKQSTSYRKPGLDLDMVDIEHYAWARKQLKSKALGDRIFQVAKLLNIETDNKDEEAIYQEINQQFTDQSLLHSKQLSLAIVIDAINEDTYKYNNDNRYDNLVEGQNSAPRQQSVFEAVANSIDAILSDKENPENTIGQFGKGIKQALTWLSSGSEDRIDIWSRQHDDHAYKTTIIKDAQGQYYIQTIKVDLSEYLKHSQNNNQGTIIKIFIAEGIPVTSQEISSNQYVSQEEIVNGLHKRYPFITNIRINTKRSDEQDLRYINGYETKQQLIPQQEVIADVTNPDGSQRIINVEFTKNTIAIIDNGKGMGAQVIADMFVPQSGTKHPAPLSGEATKQELEKVKAVYDFAEGSPKRLSFARNGEVIMALDIPQHIITAATVDHNFMLDGARLFDVSDARDAIKPDIPSAEQDSNFQEAITHMVSQIVKNQDLDIKQRLQFINTISVGLEKISTDANRRLLIDIKKQVRQIIEPLVSQLEREGFLVLPHFKEFEKIAVPSDRTGIVYLDPDTFNWLGVAGMKKSGAKQIPGIYFGDNQDMPLLMMDFTPKHAGVLVEPNRDLIKQNSEDWLQVVATESYLVIPTHFGKRLIQLADKFNKDVLTEAENLELKTLVQAINIHTATKVVTSYEVAKELKKNANLVRFEVEEGQVDSLALSNFLQPKEALLISDDKTKPTPASSPAVSLSPPKFGLTPLGEIYDLTSGEKGIGNIESLTYLGNNHYLINQKYPGGNHLFVVQADTNVKLIRDVGNSSYLAVDQIVGDKYVGRYENGTPGIFDAKTGEYSRFAGKITAALSDDGKYSVVVNSDSSGQFAVVDELSTELSKSFFIPGSTVNIVKGTPILIFGDNKNGYSFFDASHELRNDLGTAKKSKYADIIPGPHYLILKDFDGNTTLYHYGENKRILAPGGDLPEGEIITVTSLIGEIVTTDIKIRKKGIFAKGNKETLYLDENGKFRPNGIVNMSASTYFSYSKDPFSEAYYGGTSEKSWNYSVVKRQWNELPYRDLDHSGVIVLPGLFSFSGESIGIIDNTSEIELSARGTIVAVENGSGLGLPISRAYSYQNGEAYLSKSGTNILQFLGKAMLNHESKAMVYKGKDSWMLVNPEQSAVNNITTKDIEISPDIYDQVWNEGGNFVFYSSTQKETLVYDPIKEKNIEYIAIAPDYASANTVEELIAAVRARGTLLHLDGKTEVSAEVMAERIEKASEYLSIMNVELKVIPSILKITRTDGLATRLAMLSKVKGATGYAGYFMPDLTPDASGMSDYADNWNKNVIGEDGEIRDTIISKVQGVYGSILDSLPEDIQSDKEIISKLSQELQTEYSLAESGILSQFLKNPAEFVFSDETNYSLIAYSQKLTHLTRELPAFIHDLEQQLIGQPPQMRRTIYRNLIKNIFDSAASEKSKLDVLKPINQDFYYGLAYGWYSGNSQEVFDVTFDVGQLVQRLSDLGSYQAEIQKLVVSLRRSFNYSNNDRAIIIRNQIQKLLDVGSNELFIDMLTKFKKISLDDIEASISPDKIELIRNGGDVMPFIQFLINDASLVREELDPKVEQLQGQDISLEQPIGISTIQKLERLRSGAGVMTVEELITAITSNSIYELDLSDDQSQADLAELLKNISVQRESGAYTGEVAQNSYDATGENIKQNNIKKGELLVDFYTSGDEYVEEMTDNGTGAINPISLLVPNSDKKAGAQTKTVGFFGTGKFTIYEGVERVEMITNNGQTAIKFSLRVVKDEYGKPQNVVLESMIKLDTNNTPTGVTIRRIKSKSGSLPELESMIAQRSWKVFAGLTQNENFEIKITNGYNIQDGKPIPEIEAIRIDNLETLTETKMKVGKRDPGPDEAELIEGTVKTYTADDMPLQIVDRIGLRVSEYKDPVTMTDDELAQSYFALIPKEYLPHFKELGLIIQIPLPLNRDRKSFANEDFYLKEIQKYVAISFAKSLAFKRLNDSNNFTFYGFAEDSLENVGNYQNQFDPKKHPKIEQIKRIAELINTGQLDQIDVNELSQIMTMQDENIVKLVKLLMVQDRESGEQISLFIRRLNYLMEIDEKQAEKELKQVFSDSSSFSLGDIRKVIARAGGNKDDRREKVTTGKNIAEGHDQMNNPEKYVVTPSNVQEKKMLDIATLVTQLLSKDFGIEEVRLVKGTSFAGAFNFNERGLQVLPKKKIMYLSAELAHEIGVEDYGGAVIDKNIDLIIHELAHALESQIDGASYVSDLSTHQAIGRFADAMKYLSGRLLTEYDLWLENGGESFEQAYQAADQRSVLIDAITKLIRDVSNQKIGRFPRNLTKVLEEGIDLSKEDLGPILKSLQKYIDKNLSARFKQRFDSLPTNSKPAAEITEGVDQSFSNTCSSCSLVLSQTETDMQPVDSFTSQMAAKLELARANRQLAQDPNLSGGQDKAKELEIEAKNLEQEAENLKQQALSQIGKTRKEGANAHRMQNQGIQLYLNARLDTKEAEIRQALPDINKAIDSVYDATVKEEELLATQQMEVVTQTGFLGIGKKTEIIPLTTENITEVQTLLEGDDHTLGLNEMAEFERNAAGLPNKKKTVGGTLHTLQQSLKGKLPLFNLTGRARVLGRSIDISLRQSFFQEMSRSESVKKMEQYIRPVLTMDDELNLIPLAEEIKLNSTDHIKGNMYQTKEEALKKISDILNKEHQNSRFLDRDDETVVEIQDFADKLINLINQERAAAGKEKIPAAKVYVSSAQTINAYALPDGSIVIHQGLINALETKDQLFAILAHEVSHFEDKFLNWQQMLEDLTSDRAQEYKADVASTRLAKLGYHAKALQSAAEIMSGYSDMRDNNQNSFWKKRNVSTFNDSSIHIISDFAHGSLFNRNVNLEVIFKYFEFGIQENIRPTPMPTFWKKATNRGFMEELTTLPKNKYWERLVTSSPNMIKNEYYQKFIPNFNKEMNERIGQVKSKSDETELSFWQKTYNTIFFQQFLRRLNQELDKFDFLVNQLTNDEKSNYKEAALLLTTTDKTSRIDNSVSSFKAALAIDDYLGGKRLFFRWSLLFSKTIRRRNILIPTAKDLNADLLMALADEKYWQAIFTQQNLEIKTNADDVLSYLLNAKKFDFNYYRFSSLDGYYAAFEKEFSFIEGIRADLDQETNNYYDSKFQYYLIDLFGKFKDELVSQIGKQGDALSANQYWDKLVELMLRIDGLSPQQIFDIISDDWYFKNYLTVNQQKESGAYLRDKLELGEESPSNLIDLSAFNEVALLSDLEKEEKAQQLQDLIITELGVADDKNSMPKLLFSSIQEGLISNEDRAWLIAEVISFALTKENFFTIYPGDTSLEKERYELAQEFLIQFNGPYNILSLSSQLQEQYLSYLKSLVLNRDWSRLAEYLKSISDKRDSSITYVEPTLEFFKDFSIMVEMQNFLSNLSPTHINQNISGYGMGGSSYDGLSASTVSQQLRFFIKTASSSRFGSKVHFFGNNKLEADLLRPLVDFELSYFEEKAASLSGVELYKFFEDYYPDLDDKKKILDKIAAKLFTNLDFTDAYDFLQYSLKKEHNSYIHYFLENHVKTLAEYQLVVEGENSAEILGFQNNGLAKTTIFDTLVSNLVTNLNEKDALGFFEASIKGDHEKVKYYLAKYYSSMLSFEGDSDLNSFLRSYATTLINRQLGVVINDEGELVGPGAASYLTFNEFVFSFYSLSKLEKTVFLSKLLAEKLLLSEENYSKIAVLLTGELEDSQEVNLKPLLKNIVESTLSQRVGSTKVQLGIARSLADSFLQGDPRQVNNDYAINSIIDGLRKSVNEKKKDVDFTKSEKKITNLLNLDRNFLNERNKDDYQFVFDAQERSLAIASSTLDRIGIVQDGEFNPQDQAKIPVGKFITELAKSLGSLGVRFLQVFGQYFNLPPELQNEFLSVYDDASDLYMANLFQSSLTAVDTLNNSNGNTSEKEKQFNHEQSEKIAKLLPNLRIVEKIGGGSINTTYLVEIDDPQTGGKVLKVLKISNPNVLLDVADVGSLVKSIASDLEKMDKNNKDNYSIVQRLMQTLEQWNSEDIQDQNFLINDPLFSQFYPYNSAHGFEFSTSQITNIYNRWIKIEDYIDGGTLKKIMTDLETEILKQGGHPTSVQIAKAQRIEELIADITTDYVRHLNQPVTLEDGRQVYILHSDLHIGNVMANQDLSKAAVIDRNYYLVFSPEDVDLIKSLLSNQVADTAKFTNLTKHLLEINRVREKGTFSYWKTYLSYARVALKHKLTSYKNQEDSQVAFFNAMMQETDRLKLNFPLNVRLFVKNMSAINKILSKIGDDKLSDYLNGEYKTEYDGNHFIEGLNINEENQEKNSVYLPLTQPIELSISSYSFLYA